MSDNEKGFTLIELLIVASLLGVVALAVYGALSGGVRLWKQVEAEQQSNDLALAWKRLQKDTRGLVKIKALPFMGLAEEFSFGALIPVKDGAEVGRVRYYRDSAVRRLCRERLTYVDVIKGTAGECFPVFSDVGSTVFEYYGQEQEKTGAGAWFPEWTLDHSPLAVRLKVTLEGESGEGGKIEKQFTTILP